MQHFRKGSGKNQKSKIEFRTRHGVSAELNIRSVLEGYIWSLRIFETLRLKRRPRFRTARANVD